MVVSRVPCVLALLGGFMPPSLSVPGSMGGFRGASGDARPPLQEAIPDFQEALAKELRKAMRNIVSDPVFFVER